MLIRLNEDYFEEVFKILDESFPTDEHRGFEGQRSLFNYPEYVLYGKMKRQKVTGFISAWDYEEFLYIEHFAVKSNCRNKGLGMELLNEVLSETNKPAVLEVEPPDNEIASRRIRFYERNGFKYNEYEYVQLAYSATKKPVPLKIMSYPGKLTFERFINVRNIIYRKIFGVIVNE